MAALASVLMPPYHFGVLYTLRSAENGTPLAARLGLTGVSITPCPVTGQLQASAFCSPQVQLAHGCIHLGIFPIVKQAPCLYTEMVAQWASFCEQVDACPLYSKEQPFPKICIERKPRKETPQPRQWPDPQVAPGFFLNFLVVFPIIIRLL